MAEGTDRVTEIEAKAPRDPQPIEADIVRRRAKLTTLVGELNRRAHELTDVGLQVRRHALGITATVLAVGTVVAGWIALGMWRARRRGGTLTARGGRLREALGRMIDQPERVAVEPTVTQRIVGSAGSAAAAFLIKAGLERLNHPRPHSRRGSPRTDAAERWSR